MPGLMDMHVHLEGETGRNRQIERFTLNPAEFYLLIVIAGK
jgi:imidazolonepropionase-like amidohydrolase